MAVTAGGRGLLLLGMRDLNIDELQEIEEALNANLVATKPKLSLIFFNPCLTFY